MAGTVPGISMTQQLDSDGKPLNGGKLFTIMAGTTSTPQNVYQDSGLTIPWPNPIVLDSAGRVPQFFADDGSIKIRLTDADGEQQLVADNLLVVGPSGGGGGGGSIDPTTILQTGQLIAMYGTGPITGFVRVNGRTIGSANSGASERANADAEALFEYLWIADSNLSVSGGRGASAAADWAANKTIALPDCRGRNIAGLDDMGNSAASRLTSSYFGATATTLGAVGGSESHVLSINEMPNHDHTAGVTDPGHSHGMTLINGASVIWNAGGTEGFGGGGGSHTGVTSGFSINSAQTGISVAVNSRGGGVAHAIVQPTILMTYYLKL